MLYLAILIAVILLIALILFINIHIVVEYIRNKWDDHLVLSVFSLWGLLKLKYEIPLIDLGQKGFKIKKVKEKGQEEMKTEEKNGLVRFMEIYDLYIDLKKIYYKYLELICGIQKYLKRRIIMENYSLEISVGTGDAAATAMLTGVVWTAAGIFSSFLLNSFIVHNQKVKVNPEYSSNDFKIDFNCIFKIKIVHIIVVIMKILKRWRWFDWQNSIPLKG